jgi:hypothetical protein
VYSCTCLAWRSLSIGIERSICKHLRQHRGDAAEEMRVGEAFSVNRRPRSASRRHRRSAGWLISKAGSQATKN